MAQGLQAQAAGRWDKAVAHFTRAIALEPEGDLARRVLFARPAIDGALHRIARNWPRPLSKQEMFGSAGIAAIAGEALLHCVLKQTWVYNAAFEIMLTHVRVQLLQDAAARAPDFAAAAEQSVALFAALTQQCFINDYVYAQSDTETEQANALRDLLCERLKAGATISPLLVAAVASYHPLHNLPDAEALLDNDALPGDLIRQQVREPLEERQDRKNIPALTPIDNPVSMEVRQQYEENPYPRWILVPPVNLLPPAKIAGEPMTILVAGCGTGRHSIEVALRFPNAQVLAIDISLASLAYARRKTREAGLTRIDYAQADILALGSLDRRFDRIESIGVLHHLGDPKAGLAVLKSLLRPGGVLEIALYSEMARRAIVAGRALIAGRGYPPTPAGIRACRQEMLRAPDGSPDGLTGLRDFYGINGCRDLLFNVMEHRFMLPQIKALLDELDLSLVEFEVKPDVLRRFHAENPVADASDLDRWHAFETANPDTFIEMYYLLLRART